MLGLVGKFRISFYLTENGNTFVKSKTDIDDRLDENQKTIIQNLKKYYTAD